MRVTWNYAHSPFNLVSCSAAGEGDAPGEGVEGGQAGSQDREERNWEEEWNR